MIFRVIILTMQDRQRDVSRRDFNRMLLGATVGAGLSLTGIGAHKVVEADQRLQTPEADPYAESDRANAQALQDVEFGDEVTLINPRIVGVADVRILNFFGDRLDVYMQMGIMATKDEVIGLVRNIDECLVNGWEEDEIMGEPEEVRDGVNLALVDERVESIEAEVTIPKLPVVINDVEYELPLISANEVSVNSEGVTCPSATGRVAEFLEDVVRPENLRSLGDRVGEALGALIGGAVEGFDRGFNN